jgi:hypothetical protein
LRSIPAQWTTTWLVNADRTKPTLPERLERRGLLLELLNLVGEDLNQLLELLKLLRHELEQLLKLEKLLLLHILEPLQLLELLRYELQPLRELLRLRRCRLSRSNAEWGDLLLAVWLLLRQAKRMGKRRLLLVHVGIPNPECRSVHFSSSGALLSKFLIGRRTAHDRGVSDVARV